MKKTTTKPKTKTSKDSELQKMTKTELVDELRNMRTRILEFEELDKKRSEAEEELRLSERQYKALLNTTSYGIQMNDLSGMITFSNKAHGELLGFDEGELLGMYIWDMYSTEDEKNEVKKYLDYLTEQEPEPTPYVGKNLTKDGRLIELQIDWNYKRNAEGCLTGFVSIITDITEQRRAEDALKASEEKYRTLLENLPQKIFLKDKNSAYISCNENYAADLNIKSSEIVGKNDFEFYPKELAEKYRADDRKIIESRKVEDIEEMYLQDGEERYVHTVKTPLFGDKGDVAAILGIFWDITERMRTEEDKERLQAQLLHSQKMEAIGQLTGGIAHDFNNIMTSVSTLSQLGIMDAAGKEPFGTYFRDINSASKRAVNLTRQLSIFSRKKPVNFTSVDINSIIESDLLNVFSSLIGEHISTTYRLNSELWKVRADRSNMEQIIMNLFLNAMDAMSMGGALTIKTENLELKEGDSYPCGRSRGGKYVCLSVTDTGAGMDAETKEKIFEPFFTTKAVGRGTGLGLSVVYGIVESHGGCIDVKSAPGKGTTFEVYLPFFGGAEAEEAVEEVTPDLTGAGEVVLLVEDEDLMRSSTLMILTRSGYEVLTAADLTQARRIFTEEGARVDLLLSDMVLPDGNGLRLAEELTEKKPALEVVLFSGYTDYKEKLPIIEERGFYFLEKPFEIEGLLK
ncbi:MAG: PAS domain S-box protein, partial [Thermodesulfobacteriota bacterium]